MKVDVSVLVLVRQRDTFVPSLKYESNAQVRAIISDAKKLGSAAMKAEELFKKYDTGAGKGKKGDGELSLDEVVQLLNSEDYKNILKNVLGIDAHKERSEKEIRQLFEKMDTDKR